MEFEVSLTLRENGVDLMPAAKWAAQIESNPSVQTMGLSLAQGKAILTRLQTEMRNCGAANHQVVQSTTPVSTLWPGPQAEGFS